MGEFTRWYVWCLSAVISIAAVVLVIARLSSRVIPRAESIDDHATPPIWPAIVFWTTVLIAGAAGSAVWNRWQADYVFSWPLALWAGFQIFVGFSWSTRGSRMWSWNRARCYGVGIAFVILCGLYFHLCRWLGLAIEWSFLTGFLGALPFALIAAWIDRPAHPRVTLGKAAAWAASFSAYYWTCVGFASWRMGSLP
jgi:hypothetical protein